MTCDTCNQEITDPNARCPNCGERVMKYEPYQKVTLPTVDGDAEATKDGREEPWEINYPWSSERFYGSITEVKARMKKYIKKMEAL